MRSAEYPRRSRGVAATRLRGISVSRPRLVSAQVLPPRAPGRAAVRPRGAHAADVGPLRAALREAERRERRVELRRHRRHQGHALPEDVPVLLQAGPGPRGDGGHHALRRSGTSDGARGRPRLGRRQRPAQDARGARLRTRDERAATRAPPRAATRLRGDFEIGPGSPVSAEYPRGGRGGAATCHGISTRQSRRCRDPSVSRRHHLRVIGPHGSGHATKAGSFASSSFGSIVSRSLSKSARSLSDDKSQGTAAARRLALGVTIADQVADSSSSTSRRLSRRGSSGASRGASFASQATDARPADKRLNRANTWRASAPHITTDDV